MVRWVDRLSSLAQDFLVWGIRFFEILFCTLLKERRRWGLWVAPSFVCGVACFLAWPTEPSLWLSGGSLFVLVSLMLWPRVIRCDAWYVFTLLAAGAAGFFAGAVRVWLVDAPVLKQSLAATEIVGTIKDVSPTERGGRVVLAPENIRGLYGPLPELVRLNTYRIEDWKPGAKVRILASLSPPPGPAVPGGYDFARMLWFSQIGAVGFTLGRPEIMSKPSFEGAAVIEQLRLFVSARFREGMEGASGGIASALATGYRNAISDSVVTAYRRAGLSHVLSISGLHFSLVAGLAFVGLRAVLALIPLLVLRSDIKKISALFALALSVAYLVFSGASIPALRSFLMVVVFLSALLINRTALTERSLALAAVLILAVQPEAVIGPSFQMSFAAVVALVAGYEAFAPVLSRERARGKRAISLFFQWGGGYLVTIFLSTILASLATTPYVAFHFQTVPLYGVIANLLVVPVLSFWVMPWLMITVLLMPFGWENVAFPPLQSGLELIETVARTVAAWPHAVVSIPPVPSLALVLFTGAGLWLCLWRQSWRWGAIPVMVFACFLPWVHQTIPDIVISADGSLFALRSGDGLVFSPGKGDRFARSLWAERFGVGQGRLDARGLLGGEDSFSFSCDVTGCLYHRQGRQIALVFDDSALLEDCRDSDVVIARIPIAEQTCSAPVVIDADALRLTGPIAVIQTEQGISIDRTSERRGNRRWVSFGS